MATSTSSIPGGLAGLGKLKELRQRLFFVLVALFVYRVATHIPVPGINPVALAELFNQQTYQQTIEVTLDELNFFFFRGYFFTEYSRLHNQQVQ